MLLFLVLWCGCCQFPPPSLASLPPNSEFFLVWWSYRAGPERMACPSPCTGVCLCCAVCAVPASHPCLPVLPGMRWMGSFSRAPVALRPSGCAPLPSVVFGHVPYGGWLGT